MDSDRWGNEFEDEEINETVTSFKGALGHEVGPDYNATIAPYRSWYVQDINDTQEEIVNVYMNHMMMLIEKNKRYGDSALKPLGVFNKLGGAEGLLIRMDDKLKRIQENEGKIKKNDLADFIGYAMLYMVFMGWREFSDLVD
jgi:hypothetical protein